MKMIRLLDFGSLSPLRSQTVYHAAAYAFTPDSPDTIILVNSNQPYVCIGYHQDLEKEVDVGACEARGLPILRRGNDYSTAATFRFPQLRWPLRASSGSPRRRLCKHFRIGWSRILP